jgi:hypothetical protein
MPRKKSQIMKVGFQINGIFWKLVSTFYVLLPYITHLSDLTNSCLLNFYSPYLIGDSFMRIVLLYVPVPRERFFKLLRNPGIDSDQLRLPYSFLSCYLTEQCETFIYSSSNCFAI